MGPTLQDDMILETRCLSLPVYSAHFVPMDSEWRSSLTIQARLRVQDTLGRHDLQETDEGVSETGGKNGYLGKLSRAHTGRRIKRVVMSW